MKYKVLTVRVQYSQARHGGWRIASRLVVQGPPDPALVGRRFGGESVRAAVDHHLALFRNEASLGPVGRLSLINPPVKVCGLEWAGSLALGDELPIVGDGESTFSSHLRAREPISRDRALFSLHLVSCR